MILLGFELLENSVLEALNSDNSSVSKCFKSSLVSDPAAVWDFITNVPRIVEARGNAKLIHRKLFPRS